MGLFYVHQTPSYNGAFLCTKDPLLLWDLFMYSVPYYYGDLFMYNVPFYYGFTPCSTHST